ncbi:hypothetical protein GCM10023095_24680 [Pseudaeromonas paramecii]|uniref:Uncharacterized protein n=1 Tax=Pseudaeromonas paramecii TaxID=2138166 RepID=A0ABP8QGG6_9GAMM
MPLEVTEAPAVMPGASLPAAPRAAAPVCLPHQLGVIRRPLGLRAALATGSPLPAPAVTAMALAMAAGGEFIKVAHHHRQ